MAETETIFAKWMRAMGFHRKQMGHAATLIGVGARIGQRKVSGESVTTQTELLAMSAVRAGLPAWSEDNDAAIGSIANVYKAMHPNKETADA